MTTLSPAATAWQREQGRLLGIAYRMLGDYSEAEDVVSEVAELAVHAEREASEIRSWPAWLTTVCVRRSIDRVRAIAARRESYPGPWLPEPVATDRLPDDVVATREMLSIALLHLAEQLPPRQRAAIVLHRAFAMSAPEIAEILETTPAAVRQLISRGERRLDIHPDQPVSTRVDAASLDRLIGGIESGDITLVASMLEDDAVLWTDGGGVVSAALNPIFGAAAIARFVIGVFEKARRANDEILVGWLDVNGDPAIDFRRRVRRDVVTLQFGSTGRIAGIRQIANPDKHSRL
ncbi:MULTISPECIES: sigma-70 family RNA polymerase sigma factor [Microbacterium]|uniref:sigma-70 family RNA polymerase sigma factor n=1 Tax=Microbacterium TaxID=33882 RepID=UPI001E5CDBF7|nr:sigma-70 family RNA polymerase sigma factor [Microbacterium nymphoidis]MCD2496786.1 sigma-70 family RNA polymerase sigma factor [Microbacterium nymphoidis]